MKIHDVLIEAQNDEIILKQGKNEIRFQLPVIDTDQIFNLMQNPSYAELEQEREAHKQRLNEYRTSLQFAQDVYENAREHFEEQQRLFYVGKVSVLEIEEARTTYEEAEKRLQRMKSTFEGWSQLGSVTQYDESALYASYRDGLKQVDVQSLEQLKQVQEALKEMLSIVNERIYQQNNHIWNFSQQLERNAFLPRGHRKGLYGHSLSKPAIKKQA